VEHRSASAADASARSLLPHSRLDPVTLHAPCELSCPGENLHRHPAPGARRPERTSARVARGARLVGRTSVPSAGCAAPELRLATRDFARRMPRVERRVGLRCGRHCAFAAASLVGGSGDAACAVRAVLPWRELAEAPGARLVGRTSVSSAGCAAPELRLALRDFARRMPRVEHRSASAADASARSLLPHSRLDPVTLHAPCEFSRPGEDSLRRRV